MDLPKPTWSTDIKKLIVLYHLTYKRPSNEAQGADSRQGASLLRLLIDQILTALYFLNKKILCFPEIEPGCYIYGQVTGPATDRSTRRRKDAAVILMERKHARNFVDSLSVPRRTERIHSMMLLVRVQAACQNKEAQMTGSLNSVSSF